MNTSSRPRTIHAKDSQLIRDLSQSLERERYMRAKEKAEMTRRVEAMEVSMQQVRRALVNRNYRCQRYMTLVSEALTEIAKVGPCCGSVVDAEMDGYLRDLLGAAQNAATTAVAENRRAEVEAGGGLEQSVATGERLDRRDPSPVRAAKILWRDGKVGSNHAAAERIHVLQQKLADHKIELARLEHQNRELHLDVENSQKQLEMTRKDASYHMDSEQFKNRRIEELIDDCSRKHSEIHQLHDDLKDAREQIRKKDEEIAQTVKWLMHLRQEMAVVGVQEAAGQIANVPSPPTY
eukprot:Clim_evm20s171 gene=Clim_evmTU20s171